MKTTHSIITLIFAAAIPLLCHAADDIQKEKEAIKAVIEEEKAGFLALDDARMAATWIQQPSSMKLYVSQGKQTRIDGWDAIKADDQDYLKRRRANADRPQVEFSNYRITVTGDSAWVVCDARWEGISEGAPFTGTQSRVNVLQKENGRWKIALMAISQLTFEKKT
jgi:hypothetical protein